MNARLLVKTLHRPTLLRPSTAPDPHEIKLLGDGLDALLVRMQPDVAVRSRELRLLRYLHARHHCGSAASSRLDSLRREIGTALQAGWSRGKRPNLKFGRPMELRPVGLR